MKLMQEQGLKADWCITDPPYGIGYDKLASSRGGKKSGASVIEKIAYNRKGWDDERRGGGIIDLMRACSKEQIIFGGNYYTDILPPTKSWVVWNKKSIKLTDRNDFADCELAWCSKGVARVFNYMYNGMLQDDMLNKDERFHPTQKPTQIWCQLLNFYTKEGDLVLDPFAGSQSLRIACHKLKRNYIGFEIDKEYYDKGSEWYEKVTAQLNIFDFL
jgi:site-specific DNA-methyltransferase (adenine-specific)